MLENFFNSHDMREPGWRDNPFQGKGKRAQLSVEERKVQFGCKWAQNWRGGAGGRKSIKSPPGRIEYPYLSITDDNWQRIAKKNPSQAVHRIRRCYSWGMCSSQCTVSHGCTELVYTEKSTESLDQGLANSGTHARSSPDILLVNKVLLEASHAHSFVSSAWLILVPRHS